MPNHEAPFECIVCGGPESSATSTHGCRTCGAQDEIVPKGTRDKIRKHPNDVKVSEPTDGVVEYSIDGIVFRRERVTGGFNN